MQPLRIYVCGAHSTGKTTLARHIARELGLPLINEVARQVIAEMELSFETLRVDVVRAGEYQREVFRRQMEVEERYPGGFVSDRTFDNLAYAARHSMVIPQLLDGDCMRYFGRVRESLVLFVRPHRECMVNDGYREQVEWDEINRIDGILDFLLAWQQIPSVGISELNMKDRIRTAMTAVKLYQRACAAAPDPVPAPARRSTNGNGNGHSHPELVAYRS
ncbi:MAG: ATP-binding protein [Planctomycetes bacterium]|nr:ATP-binding protein [Planctomycetota bacterium]